MGFCCILQFSLLLVSVPDQAPVVAEIYPVNSKLCKLSWVPIPPEHHKGRLLGYSIVYTTHGSLETSNKFTVDTLTTRRVPIGDLRPNTYYLLNVAGFTSKGDGNYSHAVSCQTFEDGKFFLWVWSHLCPMARVLNYFCFFFQRRLSSICSLSIGQYKY